MNTRFLARLAVGAVASILLVSIAVPSRADTIYYKDGRRPLVGVIDRDRSDDKFVYITVGSSSTTIRRDLIERIEFSENVSEEESRGDLDRSGGYFDEALANYRLALGADPENERLQRKIEEVEAEIRKIEEDKYREQIEEIEEKIRLRDYDDAIELAGALRDEVGEGVIHDLANDLIAQAHLAKARQFANTVDYAGAEISYRDAMQAAPGDATAYLELARLIDSYPNRQEDAFNYYARGIELIEADPSLMTPLEFLDFRHAYADLHLRNGRPYEAAIKFWDVVQRDEWRRHPEAVDRIVQAYQSILPELVEENEKTAEAMEILEAITQANAANSRAQSIIGKVLYDRGQWAEAIPRIEAAIEYTGASRRSGEYAEMHYIAGIAYRKLGRNQDSARHLTEVLRSQRGRYEAICELGEVYLEMLDLEQALTLFVRAIPIDATNHRAYAGAGRVYQLQSRYADALRMYEQLVRIRDDEPRYLLDLGKVYAELDRPREARARFMAVRDLIEARAVDEPELRPMLGDALTQIGKSSIAENNYKEAIDFFDRALVNIPNHAVAYDGKGQAHRLLEEEDAAERNFKLAIQADPANPDYSLSLGVFYSDVKKDSKAALPHYFDYFKKGGTNPRVKDWIREAGGIPPEPASLD